MKSNQRGVAIVEFALIAIVFFTVLLGIMDFGRLLFTWNSAAEATRVGARVSVVCDKGASRVLAEMQKFIPITGANLQVDWYDGSGNISASCDSTSCAGVAVSVKGLTITPISPVGWIGFSALTVPDFSTYLPREIMGQDPGSNTVCS
ncbi:MAG: pilus assembly protein [Burkholderiales bacterium]|jgi:Flp pilus assembly protein TadG|nr:pilus assembly protein [Burkholderiales bacterium]